MNALHDWKLYSQQNNMTIMKNISITLLLLVGSMASAQVIIDNNVVIANGAVLNSQLPIEVKSTGELKVSGGLIATNDIVGDTNIVLESTASVEIDGGTLRLCNEANEVFANLKIGALGIVEVKPGYTLTLTGDINNLNTVDGLKLLANANGYSQLLTSGTVTAKGTTYAEQYFTALTNVGWRQMGSPVSATFAQIDDDFEIIYPATPGSNPDKYNVKYWDAVSSGSGTNPPANGWQDITNASWALGPGSAAVGYTVYMGGIMDVYNNGILDVSGEFGNGDYTFFTFPTSANVQQTTENIGWQLVPNPYPSNIDVNALLNDLTNFGLDYEAIHVWDAKNQQYIAITDDVTISFTGTTAATNTVNIAPFQAFWIKGSTSVNQSITLKNDHRTIDDQGNFFKTAPPLIRLNAYAANGTIDQTVMTFELGELDAVENRDAFKIKTLNDEMPTLFTTAEGKRLSINRMALPEPDKHVPMFFNQKEIKEFTIEMVENTTDPNWTIELEDHKSGLIQDLKSNAYIFINDPEFTGNRFTVHINKNGESITSANANRVNIYGTEAGIHVNFGYYIESTTANVLITTLAGQVLYNDTVNTDVPFFFPVNDYVAMYVIHVITGDKVTHEKLVIGN